MFWGWPRFRRTGVLISDFAAETTSWSGHDGLTFDGEMERALMMRGLTSCDGGTELNGGNGALDIVLVDNMEPWAVGFSRI